MYVSYSTQLQHTFIEFLHKFKFCAELLRHTFKQPRMVCDIQRFFYAKTCEAYEGHNGKVKEAET